MYVIYVKEEFSVSTFWLMFHFKIRGAFLSPALFFKSELRI